MIDSSIQRQAEDDILVGHFKATRDNEFFATLFRRHRKSIFSSCLKAVRDPGLAEDLTQETFVVAFRAIDSYREGGFASWLHRIARNLCLNLLRQRQRMVFEPAVLEKTSADENQNVDRITESVSDILSRLPDEQRTALELFAIQGYSYKEIARKMRVRMKQVKSYLQNGKRRFGIYWAVEQQRIREEVEKNERQRQPRGTGSDG
jgi:RNA polymerase sigma-70 factor, ECF subfamily